jgi:glycine cleavage system H protein
VNSPRGHQGHKTHLSIWRPREFRMSTIPDGVLYSREHEWVKIEGDVCTVGITDYAQSKLGDVVVVDLPKVGAKLEFMKPACSIESFKAVSDVYSPLTGTVVDVNSQLAADPGLVNRDPYGGGWLFKLKADRLDEEAKQLLKPEEYRRLVEGLSDSGSPSG